MKHLVRILFFIILLNNIMYSQNLVKNPSFEEYDSNYYINDWSVILHKSSMRRARHWVRHNNFGPQKLQNNETGYKYPHSRKGYAIINISDGLRLNNYRTKLKEKLKKDSLYYISFYTRLMGKSIYAVSNFGISFQKKKIVLKDDIEKYDIKPAVVFSDFICDTINWTKVSGIYKAKGGEKYLTLGMLFTDEFYSQKHEINLLLTNPYVMGNRGCAEIVYHFDDISVIKINKSEEWKYYTGNKNFSNSSNTYDKKNIIKHNFPRKILRCINIEKEKEELLKIKINNLINPDTLSKINIGDTIILRNVFFYPDDKIMRTSDIQLDLFSEYLTKYKNYKIEIGGHSNIKETEELNVWLSAEQALSVMVNIKQWRIGIERKRITYKGYGSSYIGNKKEIKGLISIKLTKK